MRNSNIIFHGNENMSNFNTNIIRMNEKTLEQINLTTICFVGKPESNMLIICHFMKQSLKLILIQVSMKL